MLKVILELAFVNSQGRLLHSITMPLPVLPVAIVLLSEGRFVPFAISLIILEVAIEHHTFTVGPF